jgi:hypothetical protein
MARAWESLVCEFPDKDEMYDDHVSKLSICLDWASCNPFSKIFETVLCNFLGKKLNCPFTIMLEQKKRARRLTACLASSVRRNWPR